MSEGVQSHASVRGHDKDIGIPFKQVSKDEQTRWESERREHNRLELERIKRQRQERESENLKKRAEKERVVLDREKESLGDWEEKECLFHLAQAYQKCYMRLREGRGRVLHTLALVTLRLELIEGKELFDNEVLLLEQSDKPSVICNLSELEKFQYPCT